MANLKIKLVKSLSGRNAKHIALCVNSDKFIRCDE